MTAKPASDPTDDLPVWVDANDDIVIGNVYDEARIFRPGDPDYDPDYDGDPDIDPAEEAEAREGWQDYLAFHNESH